MEDSTHHPGISIKDNRRRGRAGRNAASENAQETKNGLGKDNTNRIRDNEDRDLEGENGEYASGQRTIETG
jgi:hypothetical protein